MGFKKWTHSVEQLRPDAQPFGQRPLAHPNLFAFTDPTSAQKTTGCDMRAVLGGKVLLVTVVNRQRWNLTGWFPNVKDGGGGAGALATSDRRGSP